jgi:epsilon-lactone hydrolase
MSKQQRDAIDAAMRAEPFDLNQSTAEHRKSFEALMLRPYPADVTSADVTLGGVDAIELTVAGQAAEPAVLYFHGGGYVAGSARTGTHLAAELARRTCGQALSVDYRLAPEYPYPAAVEDGLAAYAGLLESGASPSRVLVAGDSAGGGLAVATLLAAREQALPQSAAVAVFSPSTRSSGSSSGTSASCLPAPAAGPLGKPVAWPAGA